MYDAWAAYDDTADPFFLGRSVGGFSCTFDPVGIRRHNPKEAQEEAASYAAYRILKHRFANSPLSALKVQQYNDLMNHLGLDTTLVSTDYLSGSPAALGNYIAECIIDFGLQDGSK